MYHNAVDFLQETKLVENLVAMITKEFEEAKLKGLFNTSNIDVQEYESNWSVTNPDMSNERVPLLLNDAVANTDSVTSKVENYSENKPLQVDCKQRSKPVEGFRTTSFVDTQPKSVFSNAFINAPNDNAFSANTNVPKNPLFSDGSDRGYYKPDVITAQPVPVPLITPNPVILSPAVDSNAGISNDSSKPFPVDSKQGSCSEPVEGFKTAGVVDTQPKSVWSNTFSTAVYDNPSSVDSNVGKKLLFSDTFGRADKPDVITAQPVLVPLIIPSPVDIASPATTSDARINNDSSNDADCCDGCCDNDGCDCSDGCCGNDGCDCGDGCCGDGCDCGDCSCDF